MVNLPTKKRSDEARRRRKQKGRTQEDKPYLLPRPHVPDVRQTYDYVAIDCEMIVLEQKISGVRKHAVASVGIVDKDGSVVYEKFVPPPSDYSVNYRSRRYCPVTNQQLSISACQGIEVLDIFSR